MRIFSKPGGLLLMLNFQNVYQNLSPDVIAELKSLWMGEGALVEGDAIEQRLQQVVYVILDSDSGKVAGVSTAVKKRVDLLNGNFLYEFRCYIGENYRIAGLDIKISKLTLDFLQELGARDPEKPVGVFTVLQNDLLQQQPLWRRAVWPETEMYFMGYTKSGNPIRVHYFKGARI
jgi:hypothetical protein